MGAYEFPGTPAEVIYGDTNGDGTVNVLDLLELLAEWNTCSDCCLAADVNGNLVVNVTDLLALLANWGCP